MREEWATAPAIVKRLKMARRFVTLEMVRDARKARWEYQHEMPQREHEELLQAAAELKGAVMLSGYRHPLYEELGWPVVTAQSYAQTGERREECLWCSRPGSLQLSMLEVE